MKDIILSIPAFHLYLMFVVTLIIMALWERETGRPVGKPRTTSLTTGRVSDALVAADCNRERAPLQSSAWPPQRDRQPFRDLQATLSASYAAKLEQAIRRIWVGSKPRLRLRL